MDFDFNKNVNEFIKKEREDTKVQELIFRKPLYSEATATKWAKAHKYNVISTRESDVTFRIKQSNEDDFVKHTFKVVNVGEGVDAVIGKKRV